MVSWPAALPRCCPVRSKPISRQLALRVHVRKVGEGLASERRETRDEVAQFARPIFGPKVIQGADEYFVYLFCREKVIFFTVQCGIIGIKTQRTKCSPMIPTMSVSSVDTGALKAPIGGQTGPARAFGTIWLPFINAAI